MIKKCEHPGCTKAGLCRAPKTRELRDYWFFCTEHAAEYNKNWNFYANMSPDEIEDEWERETFGSTLKDKDKANKDEAEYVNFLNDFLTGRDTFDKMPTKKTNLPSKVISALHTLELPITSSWREIGIKYRALAKKYHPDTAINKQNATKDFAKITEAYQILRQHFGK